MTKTAEREKGRTDAVVRVDAGEGHPAGEGGVVRDERQGAGREEAEQRNRRRRRSGKPEQSEARREKRRGGMARAERGR